jgi:multidrug resistance efflux pump
MTERNLTNLEPDEQFIHGLEQQLREGIRRRAMLDPINHATGGSRRKGMNMLATLSLMILSLVLGATGTFAVVHQDLAPQRELYLQKAAILLDRAQARLKQRKIDLAEVQDLAGRGLVNEGEVVEFTKKVAQAESELRRRELDLKETRITGRAPVDDLSAPLVGGEDFVTQRLAMQLEPLELELEQVQGELNRMENLAERGVISEHELDRALTDLKEAELTLTRLEERIDLRGQFIDGEITAGEVELRAMEREAVSEYAIALERLDGSKAHLQRVAVLHEAAAVTAGELRAAETAVREAESNLALAELQLKMIRQRLEGLQQPE